MISSMSFYSDCLESGVLLLALIVFPRVSQILEIVNKYTMNLHVPLKIIGKNNLFIYRKCKYVQAKLYWLLKFIRGSPYPSSSKHIAFGRGSSVTFLGEMGKSILPQTCANESVTHTHKPLCLLGLLAQV